MKVFITGGSGFVGRHLASLFRSRGHHVTAVGTRPDPPKFEAPGVAYLSADTTESGDWQTVLAESDVVYNLAGKSIFSRWTRSYKRELYDSRILTTRNVVAALAGDRPITLVSASAPGFYGDCRDKVLTESAKAGNDFLAGIALDWEQEALRARSDSVRVAVSRLGIVMGADGGALQQMIPSFRMFLGGAVGSGRQWFPWIHMDDLLAAMVYFAERDELEGIFNLSAPNPVRYKELAQTLGSVLKRPSILSAPGFMVRMALGEFGGTLLNSHRMVPQRLLDSGFKFRYPHLKPALEELLHPSIREEDRQEND